MPNGSHTHDQITYGALVERLQQKVSASFEELLPTIPTEYPKSETPQLRGQANRMEEGFLQAWLASR